jgi:DNA polymerase-3 subunit gamma/tau
MMLNKEAKKLSSPTRKLNKSYLGINDLMAQANEKKETVVQEEDTGDRPKDSFSIDDLRMSWRKFAFKAKEDGIGTLYTAMIARDPVIGENFEVKHTVDNDVQLGFIKTHETNLVGYLRKELNNYSIQLTIKEETAAEGKLFSSKDKFDDMAERNPHLKTLRQKFKLDIDL